MPRKAYPQPVVLGGDFSLSLVLLCENKAEVKGLGSGPNIPQRPDNCLQIMSSRANELITHVTMTKKGEKSLVNYSVARFFLEACERAGIKI